MIFRSLSCRVGCCLYHGRTATVQSWRQLEAKPITLTKSNGQLYIHTEFRHYMLPSEEQEIQFPVRVQLIRINMVQVRDGLDGLTKGIRLDLMLLIRNTAATVWTTGECTAAITGRVRGDDTS